MAERARNRMAVVLPWLMILAPSGLPAADGSVWQQAAGWQVGDDVGPLLAVEKEGIASLSDPAARAGHAARLAAVVAEKAATPDARLWACLQLRFVGTAEQVPLMASLMAVDQNPASADGRLSDAARQALEGISHPTAAAALRKALPSAKGPFQAGIAASLGRRRDAEAVPLLVPLAASADPVVAAAAVRALASIGDAKAVAALDRLAGEAGPRTSAELAAAVLRAADRAADAGNVRGDAQAAIRKRLAATDQSAVTRQAACAAELSASEPSTRRIMLLDWLAGSDPDRMIVACGRLSELDDESLSKPLASAASLSPVARLAVVTAAARRRSSRLVPHLVDHSRDPLSDVRIAAIEGLGVAASAEAVPPILAAARSDESEAVREAARGVLVMLPRRLVGEEVLSVLASGPTATADLVRLGGPAAWNSLSKLASGDDASAAVVAIAALEQVAEPTAEGLARLAAIYATARDGERRDAVARSIARLAGRLGPKAGFDPAEVVLAEIDRAKVPETLVVPLAGRLGGSRALARIDAALASSDARVREAAADGLCNWPTAEVADRLATMAAKGFAESTTWEAGRRALRAHVRVISLPSDRPADDTLARLKAAMRLAASGSPEDRVFILERTGAAVRSMPAVEWIAGHLDRDGVSPVERQAACRALVTLAHHRGLRQPNAERFDAILDRVAAATDDAALADQARRYKAGL